MNRDDVKRAADALGRLEALEAALADADRVPHDALPISFVSVGPGRFTSVDCDTVIKDDGTKAYYPREQYVRVIRALIREEQRTLNSLDVNGDWPHAVAPGLYTE